LFSPGPPEDATVRKAKIKKIIKTLAQTRFMYVSLIVRCPWTRCRHRIELLTHKVLTHRVANQNREKTTSYSRCWSCQVHRTQHTHAHSVFSSRYYNFYVCQKRILLEAPTRSYHYYVMLLCVVFCSLHAPC